MRDSRSHPGEVGPYNFSSRGALATRQAPFPQGARPAALNPQPPRLGRGTAPPASETPSAGCPGRPTVLPPGHSPSAPAGRRCQRRRSPVTHPARRERPGSAQQLGFPCMAPGAKLTQPATALQAEREQARTGAGAAQGHPQTPTRHPARLRRPPSHSGPAAVR